MYFVRNPEFENTNKRGGEIPNKSKIKPACCRSSGKRDAKLPPKPFSAGIITVLGSRPCKRPLALGAPVEPSGTGRPGTRARPGGIYTFPGTYTTLQRTLVCPITQLAAPQEGRPGLLPPPGTLEHWAGG